MCMCVSVSPGVRHLGSVRIQDKLMDRLCVQDQLLRDLVCVSVCGGLGQNGGGQGVSKGISNGS